MAARSIINFVAIFPNLDYDISSSPDKFNVVDSSLSYYDNIERSSIRTFSTNSAVESPIQGLLYVPDLDPTDPCSNLSTQFIPSNVTRQANLPTTDYNIIAIAPIINEDCTKAYLASAALDPIRAFILYHPSNESTWPHPNHWHLHQAWKDDSRWPIYGVTGVVGHRMMSALSWYSGNLTSAPFGSNLSKSYDARDYVRVYTQINTNDVTSLPKMWIFFCVILACLIVILTFTSLTWHWLQRLGRENLRRRIASGRVDLEALGIKRLIVPQEYVDRLPIYIYTYEDDGPDITSPRVARLSTKKDPFHDIQLVDLSGHESHPHVPVISTSVIEPGPLTPTSPALGDSAAVAQCFQSHHQFSCPICSDEFESSITVIRELPCHHYFHPECIDTFLTINSSLCPICKRSVFPPGYCPTQITNDMVRRERMVRHIRTRIDVESDDDDDDDDDNAPIAASLGRRVAQFGHRIIEDIPFIPRRNIRLRGGDRAVRFREA